MAHAHKSAQLLPTIERPEDIKPLTVPQLQALAQEIRAEIVQTISELGGHLASSMGAVELNLALHHVFHAPHDHLIWDMGYQAFTHKLITGRRDRFRTLKQLGGLSGFVHKGESPYDLFTSGHGGTVLSTALGLAVANSEEHGDRRVIAIIGDASLGEGMALEALNHIGHVKPNLLVVLNDNKMSIAKPVGGLSRYLNRIITNPVYNKVHGDLEQLVTRLPHGSKLVRIGHKLEESLKGMIVPGQVFEELGFRYVGPIDGHNLRDLITTLKRVKPMDGPILLHVTTVKGKGYKFAEDDPERFHKTEPFEIATGLITGAGGAGRGARGKTAKPMASFTDAFAEEIVRLGESDRRLAVLTAAMPEGTGVTGFARKFPNRFFDVGMAEQHALGLAAGLARGGMRPIFAVYSTFLQRAYDQIMHEMCLQDLPIILAIDRAGLVGEDGPTHHGLFDIAYLRVLPKIAVLSPKDPAELRVMLRWAMDQHGPVAIRYARGGIVCGEPLNTRPAKIVTGEAEALRPGRDVALLALGSMVYPALSVSAELSRQRIDAAVVNARFVKPLDMAMVREAARCGAIVTLEEAQIAGGFGSAVSEALDELGLSKTPHLRIGLPEGWVEHGKRSELLAQCQLDPASLVRRITAWFLTVKASSSDAAGVLNPSSI